MRRRGKRRWQRQWRSLEMGNEEVTENQLILQQLILTATRRFSRARYVLRNSPMVEGDRYPGRCLDVMNGLISLTEAYELAHRISGQGKKGTGSQGNRGKTCRRGAPSRPGSACCRGQTVALKAIAAAEQADRSRRRGSADTAGRG